MNAKIKTTKKTATTNAVTTAQEPAITIVGNLGKNHQIREFKSGNQVVRNSLAVHQGKENQPRWFNIEAWGAVGAYLATMADRGQRIAITGYIKQEEYEKDGIKKIKEVFKVIWVDLCVIGAAS